jgi:hypothetical protein
MKKYSIELSEDQLEFIIESVKKNAIRLLENSNDDLDIVGVDVRLRILEVLFNAK